MRIKRVVQGTALAALAAAAWMGAGSDASAATVEGIGITYDGEGQYASLNVSASDANEIIVGIAKVNTKGAKVSSWDVYDDNSAYISLEKVNVTKDAYVAIKTDKMEVPVFVKIVAAAKKNKVTLNAGTREVTFESDGTKLAADKFAWDDDGTGKFFIDKELQYQGASLTFNANGVSYEGTDDWKSEKIKDMTDDTKNGKEATVVTVGKFPSKSVKLNIPKQANGPAIPVDYVKGTVKIKKAVELRVVGNGISDVTSNAAFVDKTVAVGDFFDAEKSADFAAKLSEGKGTLEVRVAAKTDGKGKAASKWTRVAIEEPKTVDFNEGTLASASTKSAVSATVSGASVEIQYTADKKGAANGGLKITSKAGFAIDYVVSATTPTPDAKGVVKGSKTIKAGKNATVKGLSDNNKIWIRISGDKTKKQWATNWLDFYTVKLPK